MVLGLVVVSAVIHVLLPIAQHGVDDSGQLVRRGRNGLGRSQLRLLAAQERSQRTVGAVQGVGRQPQPLAARLALGLVRELMTLPPVTRLLGLNPSHEAKCLAVGHLAISVPTSLITFNAV